MFARASLAFCVALAAAGGAHAQSAPRAVGLGVSGESICALASVGAETSGSVEAPRNVAGLGASFAIEQLTNAATLSTNAANLRVAFDGICNAPHRLTITSENNGLWRLGSVQAQGQFATAVPYDVRVDWGGREYAFAFNASARGSRENFALIDAATRGDLVVYVQIAPGATNLRQNAPLAAGVYADTLRVTVGPQ